jgi:predicted lipoprotein with Yx(FWY)xxD motif
MQVAGFSATTNLEMPMSPIRISCVAVIATMLAGCARKDSTADTTAATGGGLDSAGTAAQPAPDSASAAAPAVALGTDSAAGLGKYITDANGRSVYVFMKDTKNVSTCVDACAAAWPPLGASTAASTDPSVKPGMVSVITRSDNKNQTTYNGMPVYYYEDDKKPGDIKGQGKNEFGGLWHVVSPSGQKITKKP